MLKVNPWLVYFLRTYFFGQDGPEHKEAGQTRECWTYIKKELKAGDQVRGKEEVTHLYGKEAKGPGT